jgi:hypothetical protein
MSARALVTWIIWADSAPLRTPTELGRCRAADKPSAETIAAERFPGRRILVQSAASASQAAREPIPRADSKRAVDHANRRRGKRRAQRRVEPIDAPQNLTPPEAA